MNILAARKFLTLTSFDATTEQGRSDERYRLAALSMGANVISRGVAMVVMVLTVSLTIPYLGAERFGVWMTIASFAGMLSFLDLGVGNALTNKVSQAAALNDPETLLRTISGGLGFLFILGCTVSLLLFGLADILPWQKIIKVKELAASDEVKSAIKLFSILFGFSLFSNGMQRIFAGLQRAYISHLINLTGSFFSLLALWLATKLAASIPYLLAATLGVQLIANLGLLLILINRRLFTIKYAYKNIRLEARHLLHVGGLFFVLQIGTMVGWGADSLIIASTLGASQVAVFNIAQRLFQFASQPLAMLNAPLWGAYADAHARKEKNFILKTLKKSMLLTFSFSIFVGGILIIFGQQLIKIWTKSNLIVPIELIAIFFIWTILETLGNAFAMMMNGCGVIRYQVIAVLLFVSLVIPLKILFIQFGLVYLVLATIISYLISVPIFYAFFARTKIYEVIT